MPDVVKLSLVGRPRAPTLEDQEVPPVLSIGFRPFFLLASLTAVAWVPLWLFILEGVTVGGYFRGTALHAHEMLFGFTSAVIAGFLLTAGANWTGLATTTGSTLALLSGLWLLGRVVMLVPGVPTGLVALADLAFLPALALVLARALIRAKNARNFQFLGMLAVLTFANALMHLRAHTPDWLGAGNLPNVSGQTLALRVIALMLVVMGGRVIPMFTRNGTGAAGVVQRPRLDQLSLGALLLAVSVDLVSGGGRWTAALWFLAGGLHLARMSSWGFVAALRVPLLWILNAGYAATALSFVLEGLANTGVVPYSTATHLLTVGGIGCLTLGMMTRVSLGHSGRRLVAPRSMTFAFLLLLLATWVRVGGSLGSPGFTQQSYWVSGMCWTGAFALLFAFGLPIWLSPRVRH